MDGKLDLLEGMLTPTQVEILNKLSSEIRRDWDSQIIWRTPTEARYSVLQDAKFPTPASKFHQAKKEQLVFFENLVDLSFDYQDAVIDLDEVEEKLKSTEAFEKRRLVVQRSRLQFKIEGMRLQAKDRIRELVMWSEIKAELNDGSFDTENKDTDQLIDLVKRYYNELPAALATNEAGARINIIGQFVTLRRACKERRISDEKLGFNSNKIRKMIGGR